MVVLILDRLDCLAMEEMFEDVFFFFNVVDIWLNVAHLQNLASATFPTHLNRA